MSRKFFLSFIVMSVVSFAAMAGPSGHGRVVVAPGDRFLMYEDGTPFFWLGDTGWRLFDRLNLDDARTYLKDRALKGFNVIQSVCIFEDSGIITPNQNGDLAFKDEAFTVVNDRYFDHVEDVIDLADSLGIVMAMLPSWGDKVNLKWGPGPVIFDTEEKAENYGKYIGKRFGHKNNVVFVGGGDRPVDGYENIFRAMAKGIALGISGKEDYSTFLMTYHPWGKTSCSEWFTDEPWLDFYMHQNGHAYDYPLWEKIKADYDRIPRKPVLDGEPLYDEHYIDFDVEKNGTSRDYHTRRFFYHEVFSGACGHTYGTTGIWQFYDPSRFQPVMKPSSWEQSLGLSSSYQMMYGKELMLSRPYFGRIPDQTILNVEYDGFDRITATRDSDRTYAFIYIERGKPIDIDLTAIGKGKHVVAWWYDVRSGRSIPLGRFKRVRSKVFTPPTKGEGNDWVLVIDDSAASYPPPGSGVLY